MQTDTKTGKVTAKTGYYRKTRPPGFDLASEFFTVWDRADSIG